MNLAEKIEELLKDDHMDQEAAIRLILLSQSEIIDRLSTLEEEIACLRKYQDSYPSLTWLIVHRRRVTFLIIALVFILLYLLSPIESIAIAQLIAKTLGLP